jgi:tRNA-specific 2-thiouridylase
LTGYQHEYTTIRTVSHRGPVTIVDGTPDDDDLLFAARIAARYSQGRDADRVTLSITPPGKDGREVMVPPLAATEVLENWYV